MKGQIQESKDEKSIYIDINFYLNKNAIIKKSKIFYNKNIKI